MNGTAENQSQCLYESVITCGLENDIVGICVLTQRLQTLAKKWRLVGKEIKNIKLLYIPCRHHI